MTPVTVDEELSMNAELRRADIDCLRHWMSTQPHLPSGVTDEQLILFLHCCQHRLEDCKQIIEAYYTIRTNSLEVFGNRDPKGEDVQQVLSILEFACLPKRDQHGNVVTAMRFTDMDATKFSHSASLKTYFMVHDVIMMEAGTVPGYVFLFDTSGCGLGHVSRIRLSCLKTYADYTQDAFPGNVVAIHLVNATYITKALFALVKPFFKGHIIRKIFIHTSMDTLYEHVSRDVLPKEYGGNLHSMTTYHKTMVTQLERYREWFKEEEAFRVDESKRAGREENVEEVSENKVL